MNDLQLSAEETEKFEQALKLFNETLIPFMEDFIKTIVPLIQDISIAVISAFKEIAEQISQRITALIKLYPNKRIVYLALHHPKERVRKKNMRRILKWIERG